MTFVRDIIVLRVGEKGEKVCGPTVSIFQKMKVDGGGTQTIRTGPSRVLAATAAAIE